MVSQGGESSGSETPTSNPADRSEDWTGESAPTALWDDPAPPPPPPPYGRPRPAGGRRVVLDENLFWEELMEGVDRPSARAMLPRLAPSQPMGVDPKTKGLGALFDYYLTVRARHPRKLVLSRVGDFYEAFGYDAVLLVQVPPARRPAGGMTSVQIHCCTNAPAR